MIYLIDNNDESFFIYDLETFITKAGLVRDEDALLFPPNEEGIEKWFATVYEIEADHVPVEDKERALARLRAYATSDDPESAHSRADAALCDFLKSLGHDDLVEAWQAVEKWYA